MKALNALSAALLVACSGTDSPLQEKGKLELEEVSGIVYSQAAKELWAIEDSDNPGKLYRLDNTGKTKAGISITNITNEDWEDLAADAEGNLYIGDFGNNDNDRKDLAIYKISKDSLDRTVTKASEKISFYYPEQKHFPPKRSERFFDAEAFFEHNGNFYLFTKNRSARFDGTVHIYKIPNRAGRHAAKLMGTIQTCGYYRKCVITGADISPDGTKVVLLSSDKVWLITNFGKEDFAGGDMKALELGHFSQKEAITFKDNGTLMIADEKEKRSGGYMYEVKLQDLQAKL